MQKNKYHIRIARDETRSMGRYERLWYQGTARWFLLFGLFVLAGASLFLVTISITSRPQSQVAGTAIVAPVVNRTFPHFYLVVNEGAVESLPNAKNVWESAKSGVILRDGDSIRTKTDGYATLLSNTDTVLRFAPNSEVQVLSIEDPSAKLASVSIRVVSGEAWLTVSRRAGQKTKAMVFTPHGFFTADSGIFAVNAGSPNFMAVVRGTAKVSVLTNTQGVTDSVIQNAETRAAQVAEGTQATLRPEHPSALIDTEKISDGFRKSYWFQWNTNQDSLYQSSLNNSLNTSAPPLNIDESSRNIVAHGAPFVVVAGTTSLDARVFVNTVEVENRGGTFKYAFSFGNHKGPERDVIHVVAMNRFGESTSEDVVAEFVPEVPLTVTP